MKKYTYSSNIKIGLLFFGLALMAGAIFYSNSIVSQLRDDNRQIVTVYSRIIANTINEESDANLGFVFDEIIKKVQFPIVYTDKLNTPLYSRNIDQNKNKDEMLNLIKSMDKNNKPIPIEYYDSGSNSKMLLGYLHFGDSILVQRLEWLPYLEILIVLMFVIVGFLGFNSLRSIPAANPQSLGLGPTNTSFLSSFTILVFRVIFKPHPPAIQIGKSGY